MTNKKDRLFISEKTLGDFCTRINYQLPYSQELRQQACQEISNRILLVMGTLAHRLAVKGITTEILVTEQKQFSDNFAKILADRFSVPVYLNWRTAFEPLAAELFDWVFGGGNVGPNHSVIKRLYISDGLLKMDLYSKY